MVGHQAPAFVGFDEDIGGDDESRGDAFIGLHVHPLHHAVNRAMAGDKIADPAVRDPETTAMRTLVSAFREDERFTSALLPIGGGLLVASTRRE